MPPAPTIAIGICTKFLSSWLPEPIETGDLAVRADQITVSHEDVWRNVGTHKRNAQTSPAVLRRNLRIHGHTFAGSLRQTGKS